MFNLIFLLDVCLSVHLALMEIWLCSMIRSVCVLWLYRWKRWQVKSKEVVDDISGVCSYIYMHGQSFFVRMYLVVCRRVCARNVQMSKCQNQTREGNWTGEMPEARDCSQLCTSPRHSVVHSEVHSTYLLWRHGTFPPRFFFDQAGESSFSISWIFIAQPFHLWPRTTFLDHARWRHLGGITLQITATTVVSTFPQGVIWKLLEGGAGGGVTVKLGADDRAARLVLMCALSPLFLRPLPLSPIPDLHKYWGQVTRAIWPALK